MKRVPIKERLVNEKTIDRYADKTAVACILHPENKKMNDIRVKSCEVQGVLVSCIKMY